MLTTLIIMKRQLIAYFDAQQTPPLRLKQVALWLCTTFYLVNLAQAVPAIGVQNQ